MICKFYIIIKGLGASVGFGVLGFLESGTEGHLFLAQYPRFTKCLTVTINTQYVQTVNQERQTFLCHHKPLTRTKHRWQVFLYVSLYVLPSCQVAP